MRANYFCPMIQQVHPRVPCAIHQLLCASNVRSLCRYFLRFAGMFLNELHAIDNTEAAAEATHARIQTCARSPEKYKEDKKQARDVILAHSCHEACKGQHQCSNEGPMSDISVQGYHDANATHGRICPIYHGMQPKALKPGWRAACQVWMPPGPTWSATRR